MNNLKHYKPIECLREKERDTQVCGGIHVPEHTWVEYGG